MVFSIPYNCDPIDGVCEKGIDQYHERLPQRRRRLETLQYQLSVIVPPRGTAEDDGHGHVGVPDVHPVVERPKWGSKRQWTAVLPLTGSDDRCLDREPRQDPSRQYTRTVEDRIPRGGREETLVVVALLSEVRARRCGGDALERAPLMQLVQAFGDPLALCGCERGDFFLIG